jgi:hypothetical protein
MRLDSPQLSAQEMDCRLFLETLGLGFPIAPQNQDGEFALVPLCSPSISFLQTRDGIAGLLCYCASGTWIPLSLLFLKGNTEFVFCHSTLLLDSYTGAPDMAALLRQKTTEFFAGRPGDFLSKLWPDWNTLALKGQEDCRILWLTKPTLPVATKVYLEKRGSVPDLPLFPSTYSYNNPYVENLLEVGLPELGRCKRVLVLGTGAGIDAACIALQYDIPVDATDINPISVANTIACARRSGVAHLVQAWESDGFSRIPDSYDAIFFEAPLAVEELKENDPNRYDFGGRILKRVLSDLPSHLNPDAAMYLMSQPDISPYMPARGLCSKVRRYFEAKSKVAIHEIRRDKRIDSC